MRVEVMIAMYHPEKVDPTVVKAALPHGQVAVNAVRGGLDVPGEPVSDLTVIAGAAIERCAATERRRFRLSFRRACGSTPSSRRPRPEEVWP
jgi:hypothetical protein